MSKGQQILGWAILFACLLAVPVQFMDRGKSTSPEEKNDTESRWRSFFISKRDRITVVRLNGMISEDEGQASLFPDSDSAAHVRKILHKAAKNEHIKAILLRINSPGGTVAASQEISNAIKEVRAKGKPVYVSMGDVTASGGYYIAAAADRIVANPGTLTGSIGVIMHLLNLQQIERKLGVEPLVIKSGTFKDIGSMDRPASKEEKELLQSIIMDSYDQFVCAVAEGRNMDKEQVKKLADGRIYSGRQALKVNLVDELGGYEEALASLQKAARAKYHLQKDLAVDDGHSSVELLSSVLFSKLSAPQGSVLQGLLPVSLEQKFCNQPLWLMQ